MSGRSEMNERPSFYARHLHLLGLENRADVTADDAAAEIAAMSGFDLPDLHFGPDNAARLGGEQIFSGSLTAWIRDVLSDFLAGNSGMLGAAAMALLIILPMTTMTNRNQDELPGVSVRVKGSDKVILHLERSGAVVQFQPGQKLENGDRLRIEVMTASDRVVFQFVTNSDRQLLTSPGDIMNERMRIPAGERGIFPGSIELVGADEGEILNVVICEGMVDSRLVANFIREFPAGGRTAPNGCLLHVFELR